MVHDPHQPKRTGHTPIRNVPLKPKMDSRHQRLLLAVGVGLSALVIFGLYAASFRYQRALTFEPQDASRWTAMKNDLLGQIDEIGRQAEAIGKVKSSLDAVIGAKTTQAESIAIMKQKIESGTSTQTK